MTSQAGNPPDPVSLTVTDNIGVVRIDNPPVNALDEATYLALAERFTEVNTLPDVRAAVLTAAGTRAFCAGTDVRDFGVVHHDDPGWQDRHSERARRAFFAIYNCRVPVVGAVQATAVGAGIPLVASCDVVVAADSAKFGLPEIDVGVLGGARHLSRLVPQQYVRWMMYTGRRITAHQLQAFGSVLRVVPADEVLGEALAVAREIAEKIPRGIQLAKEGLNHLELCDLDLERGYMYEQTLTRQLKNDPQAIGAAKEFLQKR
ncbi:MAG: hypothetical protein GEV03_22005 [Streptosporangiales bacterium]|nr:hypothetical protein [Streptosporangiales bacterium]